jgi:hypothetical protein
MTKGNDGRSKFTLRYIRARQEVTDDLRNIFMDCRLSQEQIAKLSGDHSLRPEVWQLTQTHIFAKALSELLNIQATTGDYFRAFFKKLDNSDLDNESAQVNARNGKKMAAQRITSHFERRIISTISDIVAPFRQAFVDSPEIRRWQIAGGFQTAMNTASVPGIVFLTALEAYRRTTDTSAIIDGLEKWKMSLDSEQGPMNPQAAIERLRGNLGAPLGKNTPG